MKQALKLADYEEVNQLMREMGFVYLTFAEGLHALDAEYITHGGNYKKRIKFENKTFHRFSGYVTMKLTSTVNELRLRFSEIMEEILEFSTNFFTDGTGIGQPQKSQKSMSSVSGKYKNAVRTAMAKIDSKYDGILSMPAGHQKENSDYIYEKFCEGLQLAGFAHEKDKSKSQNALLLNPFHDNDEANFSMLEKEETPQGGKSSSGHPPLKFNKLPDGNIFKDGSVNARKSEDILFEELSFSSDIIDFWNNRPVNRNRNRVVCDFLDDAPDKIFFSEVSTDPTARHNALGDDNNNYLCHSVGDLYNFLNPDLSTEGKTIDHQKSGEDILELMQKKAYTTHSSFGGECSPIQQPSSRDNKGVNLRINEAELGEEFKANTLESPKEKKDDKANFEKLGDSPADQDDEKRKMNDGFVMSESNEIHEIIETRDFQSPGDAGLAAKEAGLKASKISPDIEKKLLSTPEKTATSSRLVTLGSAMNGRKPFIQNELIFLDIITSTEIYSKERGLSVKQTNTGLYLTNIKDKSEPPKLLIPGKIMNFF